MNLAAYRTAILQKLDDTTQAKYPNAQLDEALRAALLEYSRMQPIPRTWVLDTDGNAVIPLPSHFRAVAITKAQYEKDSTTYDQDSEIEFSAEEIDEGWQIETITETIEAGQVITLTYHALHTIDDLDSESGTTVRDQHEQALVLGAAGYAILSRSNSRIEAINLNPGVAREQRALAANYIAEFRAAVINRGSKIVRSYPTFTEPSGF